jgi:iron complex outermembrane receptor protein
MGGPAVAADSGLPERFTAPPVSVSGTRLSAPLSEVLRPSEFVAPTPDAAALLRTVPGFSLSRVGGAASDPLLRGFNGSRIQLVADGAAVDAACNHRMDPPTSYLAAESFDRVVVTKGPSTVRFGAPIAGTIDFQRDTTRTAEGYVRGNVGLQAGSFQQRLATGELRAGGPRAALRAWGSGAESDNYSDGNGNPVHSAYSRWNAGASVGWFPNERGLVQLGVESGDGTAAFPTFHMDGIRFRRDRASLKLRQEFAEGPLARLELRGSVAATDHGMDDYSLRPPHVTVTAFPGATLTQTALLVMDQTISAGSLAAESAWRVSPSAELLVGADAGRDRFEGTNDSRTTNCLQVGATVNCVANARRWIQYDLTQRRAGVFAEIDWWMNDRTRLKSGARADRIESTAGALFDFIGSTSLAGANSTRTETARGAFVRLERELHPGWNAFAALGQAERPASPLERASFNGFFLEAERNRQLDAGVGYGDTRRAFGLDVFLARIDDYILIVQGTRSRNVDARTFGAEAYGSARLGERLRTSASLAFVRGDNFTDGVPLAQMPPLEFRLGAEYVAGPFSVGMSGRMVSRQDRVDVGSGNVTGVDLGPTPGFSVWGVRAAWQADPRVRFSVGVENLFDKLYAEHLNRTGGFAPAGFVPTFRVNEPGRVLWFRVDLRWS